MIPCLLYGFELFGNCDSNSKRNLKVLFYNIAEHVYNLKRYDHISVAIKCLYGVTFDNLLNIYVLLFLHRIINRRIPTYLFNRLHLVQSPRSKHILVSRHRYLFSEWQFYLYAIRFCNIIPLHQQSNNNASGYSCFNVFLELIFNFFPFIYF